MPKRSHASILASSSIGSQCLREPYPTTLPGSGGRAAESLQQPPVQVNALLIARRSSDVFPAIIGPAEALTRDQIDQGAVRAAARYPGTWKQLQCRRPGET